jgi:hypothetical protein
MTKAIAVTFATTPDWRWYIHRYIAIEVHPCKVVNDPKARCLTFVTCEPSRSCLWSICGRRQDGSLHSFDQYPTATPARRSAKKLVKAYPHLKAQTKL